MFVGQCQQSMCCMLAPCQHIHSVSYKFDSWDSATMSWHLISSKDKVCLVEQNNCTLPHAWEICRSTIDKNAWLPRCYSSQQPPSEKLFRNLQMQQILTAGSLRLSKGPPAGRFILPRLCPFHQGCPGCPPQGEEVNWSPPPPSSDPPSLAPGRSPHLHLLGSQKRGGGAVCPPAADYATPLAWRVCSTGGSWSTGIGGTGSTGLAFRSLFPASR